MFQLFSFNIINNTLIMHERQAHFANFIRHKHNTIGCITDLINLFAIIDYVSMRTYIQ